MRPTEPSNLPLSTEPVQPAIENMQPTQDAQTEQPIATPTESSPISQPIQLAQPVQPLQPPLTTTPAPLNESNSSNNSAKSYKGLIIGLAAAGAVFLVAVVVGFVAWFTVWSPMAHSLKLSNSFMQSVSSGDVKSAVALTGDKNSQTYLSTASQSVHGSYHLMQSTYTGGTGFYLYNLTGGSKKYARTIVKQHGQTRRIDSFVYSNSVISLIPTTGAQPTADSTPTPAATSMPTSGACLVMNDFATISPDGYNDQYSMYTSSSKYDEFALPVLFSADSKTYDGSASGNSDTVQKFVDFDSQNSTKQFSFDLTGSVATTSSADLSFANDRAAVLKDVLIKAGVTHHAINILPADSISSYGNDTSLQDYTRQVEIAVNPTCSTNTNTTNLN